MDSAKSSGQTSSLDSLRTVEFRQTLRGYHIDDVDEYLEKVAVDVDALQEQMRQAGERLKQAAERIAQLETMLQEAQQQTTHAAPAVTDDTLQRTLVLAQKFVDQTQAEAEAQARVMVSDAEERARRMLNDAEQRAKTVTEDTERHLRDEITRLESMRTQLAGDVETIARHIENERSRLRGALSDMLSWVDEHVQPAASLLSQRAAPRPALRPEEMSASPSPVSDTTEREPGAMESAGRQGVPVQGNAPTGGAQPVGGEEPPMDAQGVMPMDGTAEAHLATPR
jgi:cell division initiation protein